MSHGGGGDGGIKAEPNLTPMLDMVLQLVMFFMMVANFAMEQVNTDIMLPVAQSARPTDKREADVLYLNVNSEGKVIAVGRNEPLSRLDEIEFYLKDEAEAYRREARARGESGDEIKRIAIIRADKNADYAQVYTLLQVCKKVGFRRLQLNAMTSGPGG